jgi:hypothetical protein
MAIACAGYRVVGAGAVVASETEAKEIVTKAKEFVEVVEQWIAKNHSSLKT